MKDPDVELGAPKKEFNYNLEYQESQRDFVKKKYDIMKERASWMRSSHPNLAFGLVLIV